MNAIVQAASLVSIAVADLPSIGEQLGGGFYSGRLIVPEGAFAIVVAGKEGEIAADRWNKNLKRVDGATSFYDGMANTIAMADAGSRIARAALDLRIGGFDDWYIGARDELELVYRHLKPSADKNWVHRNGENPSSFPVGYPYTATAPGQTAIEAFREGGEHALALEPYWASTQREDGAGCAWVQGFGDGDQYYDHKDYGRRARVIRRISIQ